MTRQVLSGHAGSPGVAAGRMLWVSGGPIVGETSPVVTPRDPDREEARLMAALERAAEALESIARETTARAGPDVGEIFSAQALFARDPSLIEPATSLIREGASAVEAIDRVAAEQADQLAGVDDAYFRERSADLRDVGRRVVDLLLGRTAPALHRPDGSPAVLAAVDLDPSLVAAIRPELVTGLALAAGAANGHMAIVARALGIPLVLGLGPAVDAGLDGRPVVVDGDAGRLILDPGRADMPERNGAGPHDPAATRAVAVRHAETSVPGFAGFPIAANVGSLAEAQQAARAGADGIGLVRTELVFLGRTTPPGLAEQRGLYARIAAAMTGRPVVFRTLDVGGDKPAGFEPSGGEANPALGVRGLRLGLRRPELLETQLRAIIEATPEAPARILLPMVSTIDEIRAARAAIERAIERSRADGVPASRDVLVGVMIEVPALALVADLVAAEVDFLSVGTNDLVQYTLAADRTNAALAELASPFQPAVLRLVDATCRAARAAGRPVTVCGEAAADPLAAALFLGLGVTELSVSPRAIGPLRSALAALDQLPAGALDAAAAAAVRAGSAADVRSIADALLGQGAGRS